MPHARISVIIPAFNRGHTLPRALDSVRAQTRAADEILIVDDGSTDNTAEVLTAFPRVHCIRQENRGVSAARNTGIRAATGDWLAFLDSDDEWRPRKLELQVHALSSSPESRIVHCDEIWVRNGRRVNPGIRHRKRGGQLFRHCLPLCCISPSAVMIQRTLLAEIGPFDEDLPVCEDYDIWLRICSRFAVLFVDEPLVVKHGGHADQLSRRYAGMDRFRVSALHKLLRSDALRPDDRHAAAAVLLKKAQIYLDGAIKRGRLEQAGAMSELMNLYRQESTAPVRRRRGLAREPAVS